MSTNPDLQIFASRIVNAPIHKAFEAWSNPNHLKNWWGPNGFSNTFHEFDFRIGGQWKFIMHGPEKGHYENACEFTRIEAPNLIEWKRHSKPLFRVLATFEEISANQTKVSFHQIFDSIEECNKIKPHVSDKNEENLDRLEKELAKMF